MPQKGKSPEAKPKPSKRSSHVDTSFFLFLYFKETLDVRFKLFIRSDASVA
jgi:hypothetical protein